MADRQMNQNQRRLLTFVSSPFCRRIRFFIHTTPHSFGFFLFLSFVLCRFETRAFSSLLLWLASVFICFSSEFWFFIRSACVSPFPLSKFTPHYTSHSEAEKKIGAIRLLPLFRFCLRFLFQEKREESEKLCRNFFAWRWCWLLSLSAVRQYDFLFIFNCIFLCCKLRRRRFFFVLFFILLQTLMMIRALSFQLIVVVDDDCFSDIDDDGNDWERQHLMALDEASQSIWLWTVDACVSTERTWNRFYSASFDSRLVTARATHKKTLIFSFGVSPLLLYFFDVKLKRDWTKKERKYASEKCFSSFDGSESNQVQFDSTLGAPRERQSDNNDSREMWHYPKHDMNNIFVRKICHFGHSNPIRLRAIASTLLSMFRDTSHSLSFLLTIFRFHREDKCELSIKMQWFLQF